MATCTRVKRQTHLSYSGTENNGVRVATEMYIITFDADTTPVMAEGANDGTTTAPTYGSAHPDDPTRLCKRIEVRGNEDSRAVFQLRAEYSDDLDVIQNPLTLPPKISWDFGEDGEKPYFMDNDPAGAKPVVNKAGELFSDYLQRVSSYITCTYQKNVTPTGFDMTQLTVDDHQLINSDGFSLDGYSIGQYQARLAGVSESEIQKQNGVQYRTVKFVVKLRNSWTDVVDNRGFHSKIILNGNTTLKAITIGHPPKAPDRPWPLQADGSPCANITDAPTQLTFYPYKAVSFASFGFT